MQLLSYDFPHDLVLRMEGFTFGSILASIVASIIFAGVSYLFIKKKADSKQENEIDDTKVIGNIEQEIETASETDSNEQHLKINKSHIDGGISQKVIKKKV